MEDLKGRKKPSMCIIPLVSVQPGLAATIYQRLDPPLPSGSLFVLPTGASAASHGSWLWIRETP